MQRLRQRPDHSRHNHKLLDSISCQLDKLRLLCTGYHIVRVDLQYSFHQSQLLFCWQEDDVFGGRGQVVDLLKINEYKKFGTQDLLFIFQRRKMSSTKILFIAPFYYRSSLFTCPAHLIALNLIVLIIFGAGTFHHIFLQIMSLLQFRH